MGPVRHQRSLRPLYPPPPASIYSLPLPPMKKPPFYLDKCVCHQDGHFGLWGAVGCSSGEMREVRAHLWARAMAKSLSHGVGP